MNYTNKITDTLSSSLSLLSRVEGKMSRVESKKSRVESKKSRVERKKSRVTSLLLSWFCSNFLSLAMVEDALKFFDTFL